MKKPIILGFILMFISIFIGKILSNWMLTIKISGILGLICFVLVGALNGSFLSGDRNRANYVIDTKQDKIIKMKVTIFSLAVGLPNIILAVIVFLLIKKS